MLLVVSFGVGRTNLIPLTSPEPDRIGFLRFWFGCKTGQRNSITIPVRTESKLDRFNGPEKWIEGIPVDYHQGLSRPQLEQLHFGLIRHADIDRLFGRVQNRSTLCLQSLVHRMVVQILFGEQISLFSDQPRWIPGSR